VAVAALALAAIVGADSAGAATTATVQAESPVYLIDQGGTAHVGLKLTTPDGTATTAAFTVSYSMGGGITFGTAPNVQTLPDTATPGVDYTQQSANVTFPEDTASGTVLLVDVATLADTTAGEKAETVTVALGNPAANANLTLPANTPPTVVINAHGFPYLDDSLPISQRVDDLVSRMSLDEKVGQMTQPERAQFTTTANTSNNNSNDIAAWLLGSILSGGGSVPPASMGGNTPQGWANMVDDFELRALRTPLQIPLVYGIDSVHGDNNLVGATVFPHNIGMGATRDPALSEQEGHIAASETRATGPQWAFAPCLCVARDDRWGRTFESYGEDPALVSLMETSIDGFQGTTATAKSANDRVLATAKHFAGDGGTKYGTGDSGYRIDQGITMASRADFDRLFVSPYEPAVQQHHVGSIMPSYSSVDFTDDGLGNPVKMHAQKELLTDVLKDRIGFDGFLISDYDGLNQIATADSASPRPTPQQIEASINAGMDMVMVPNAYRLFETNLRALVPGSVPTARIDDAVKRILRQKFELRLFEHPFTDTSNISQIRSTQHLAVARTAAAESQVLLKNSGDLLPLAKGAKVYLAGSNADDLGNQTGGWTVDWQGASGNDRITEGTTIGDAIEDVAPGDQVTYSRDGSAPRTGNDVGVVVVGEGPYAEGQGDVGTAKAPSMNLSAADQLAVERVCGDLPCAVVVVSGRPLSLPHALEGDVPALVASWLPGTEGAGVADTLFGDTPYTGRLPVTWPRNETQEPINVGDADYDPAYAFGWGLRTDSSRTRLQGVRDALAGLAGDAHAAAAAETLGAVLAAGAAWDADGGAADQGGVLAALDRAAAELDATGAESATQDDRLVSVARDIAQDAIAGGASGVPDNAQSLTADAEHELLVGHVEAAVALLTQASGIDLEPFTDFPFSFDDFNFDFPIDRSVRVGHSKLRVDRRRHARVRIVCGPTTEFRCRGTLDARLGKRVIGQRSFSIEPNFDTYVVLRFNKSSYRRLVRQKSLKVVLRIRTRGSDGVLRSATARVTLTRAVTK
jgi:beta-glucosidase